MNDDLMKDCPYCAEPIRVQATKCRYCRSHLNDMRHPKQWHRDTKNGKIAGVCAGLAIELGLPLTLLRLLWIASVFVGGGGLIIYIILWLIMPEFDASKTSAPKTEEPEPRETAEHRSQARIIGRSQY